MSSTYQHIHELANIIVSIKYYIEYGNYSGINLVFANFKDNVANIVQ